MQLTNENQQNLESASLCKWQGCFPGPSCCGSLSSLSPSQVRTVVTGANAAWPANLDLCRQFEKHDLGISSAAPPASGCYTTSPPHFLLVKTEDTGKFPNKLLLMSIRPPSQPYPDAPIQASHLQPSLVMNGFVCTHPEPYSTVV